MKTDQKALTPADVFIQLESLGAALRGFRLAKRLTHEEAADSCAFSRQTLSRIEKGDPSVAIGQIARYASLLGARKAFQLKSPKKVDVASRRVRRTSAEKRSAPYTQVLAA